MMPVRPVLRAERRVSVTHKRRKRAALILFVGYPPENEPLTEVEGRKARLGLERGILGRRMGYVKVREPLRFDNIYC